MLSEIEEMIVSMQTILGKQSDFEVTVRYFNSQKGVTDIVGRGFLSQEEGYYLDASFLFTKGKKYLYLSDNQEVNCIGEGEPLSLRDFLPQNLVKSLDEAKKEFASIDERGALSLRQGRQINITIKDDFIKEISVVEMDDVCVAPNVYSSVENETTYSFTPIEKGSRHLDQGRLQHFKDAKII